MLKLLKVLWIMLNAHRGQKDKGGKPYFLHPIRVSRNVKNKDAKIVALLHDVIEDSDKYTFDDLKFLNNEQLSALRSLTHDKSVDYFAYIKDIKENKIAREVKLADLKDNSNLRRIKNPSQKDFERIKKYQEAIEELNSYTVYQRII